MLSIHLHKSMFREGVCKKNGFCIGSTHEIFWLSTEARIVVLFVAPGFPTCRWRCPIQKALESGTWT